MNPVYPADDNDGKRKHTVFEIRPYKISELARIYHVNVQTFNKWIARYRQELGPVTGHYLTIEQVETIILHLKLPYFIRVETLTEEKFEEKLEEHAKKNGKGKKAEGGKKEPGG